MNVCLCGEDVFAINCLLSQHFIMQFSFGLTLVVFLLFSCENVFNGCSLWIICIQWMFHKIEAQHKLHIVPFVSMAVRSLSVAIPNKSREWEMGDRKHSWCFLTCYILFWTEKKHVDDGNDVGEENTFQRDNVRKRIKTLLYYVFYTMNMHTFSS